MGHPPATDAQDTRRQQRRGRVVREQPCASGAVPAASSPLGAAVGERLDFEAYARSRLRDFAKR